MAHGSNSTLFPTSQAHPGWNLDTTSRAGWFLLALLAYGSLVALLRFRRIEGLTKKYADLNNNTVSKMTDQQAFEIIQAITDLEFPTMFEKGLQYALLRTYAIPTISDLLVKTTQLIQPETVGKRYTDTAALVAEMYGNAPSSDRSIEGFSRLNYLHGHYIKQGRILNDDMLYTLALFMNKPVALINQTEWRQLTDLEICAMGVFHKSMGDAMEIDFSVLPSSKLGFRDGVHFYNELDTWSRRYEQRVMVPDKNNHSTAIATQELLLSTIPPFLHGPFRGLLAAAMDELLRQAIMFDKPAKVYQMLFRILVATRKFLLRHFALPRPEFMASKFLTEELDAQREKTCCEIRYTADLRQAKRDEQMGPRGVE